MTGFKVREGFTAAEGSQNAPTVDFGGGTTTPAPSPQVSIDTTN
jgi:hypothetical protein